MSFQIVQARVPDKWFELMHELIRAGIYPNRSELVRVAIRQLLKEDGVWPDGPQEL